MKKQTILFTITAILLLTATLVQSQVTIEVKVTDLSNNAIKGAKVYSDDGTMCVNGTTDWSGKTELQVSSLQNLTIYAYDPDKRYGMSARQVQSSRATYHIQLQDFPRNKTQATKMIDNVVSAISKASDLSTLKSWFSGSGSAMSGTLGVPGVFSISPIPVKTNGQIGFKVSGSLVEPLRRVGCSQSRMYGCEYELGAM